MKKEAVIMIVGVHCALAVATLFSGCAGAREVTSRWQTDAVAIEGGRILWGTEDPSHDGDGLRVAVRNDSDYLYLSLTSREAATRMLIMRAGLTVWFDRGGGREKVLGINYPRGATGRSARPDSGRGRGKPVPPPTDFVVLGPGRNDRYTFSTVERTGIQAVLGGSPEEGMVYELRVPLRTTAEHRFAVGAEGEGPIGIGFETGEVSEESMQQPEDLRGRGGPERGDMPPPGGGGGAPGMGPDRGGGGQRSGRSHASEAKADPVDFWLRVRLAREPHEAK